MYKITELQKSDYDCGFLQLLEQLTIVDADKITYNDFINHYNQIQSKVFVIKEQNKVIATCSVFIEYKFIHQLGSIAHIEDVVVDLNYRKKGLGKMLIEHCLAYIKLKGCYKVILNCEQKNVKFYEKCGFHSKNVEMSLYINQS